MEELLNKLKQRDSIFQNIDQEVRDAVAISEYLLNQRSKKNQLILENQLNEEKLQQLQSNGITSSSDVTVDELNKQLVDLYRKKDSIKQEFDAVTKEVKGLGESKESKKANIVKMKEEQTKLDSEISSFEEKLIKLASDHQQIVNEGHIIEGQISNIINDVEEVTTRVSTLRKRVKESTDFIAAAEKTSTRICLDKFYLQKKLSDNSINDICFGPGFGSFIVVTDDKKLIQTSLPSMQEILNINTDSICNRIKLEDQSKLLALCCQDSKIRILDTVTGRFISTLESHKSCVTDFEWITKNTLISCSKDRTVKQFDINRKACIMTINAVSQVYGLTKVMNGNNFVYGGACMDGTIRIFDVRQKNVAMKIEKAHTRSIASILSSGDDSLMISTGFDNNVVISDLRGAKKVATYTSPDLIVKNLNYNPCLTPGGGYLCAGSANNAVVLFDLSGEKPPVVNKKHESEVICSSASTNLLITGDKNGVINMWVKD